MNEVQRFMLGIDETGEYRWKWADGPNLWLRYQIVANYPIKFNPLRPLGT